jgi:hypothetical protein
LDSNVSFEGEKFLECQTPPKTAHGLGGNYFVFEILLDAFLSLKWEMDMVFIYGMMTGILVVLSLRVSVLELFMTLRVALMLRLLLF